MATPLDMQPVVDTQVDSPKSNILAQVSDACKKLGIAVTTAAALHCSPAFAQSAVSPVDYAIATATKGSGVLTIDGKNMSFIEFLTKYPEQKERSTILGKMDEKTEDAFRDWEVSMEDNNINKKNLALNQKILEDKTVDVVLNQVTGSVDGKKEALNQHEALKILINTLSDEQGLLVWADARYRVQADIVTAILSNPLARPKNPETVAFLQNMEASLKKGKNPFAYMSAKAKDTLRSAMN